MPHSGKQRKITASLASKVLCLRALLILTRKRPRAQEYNEEVYGKFIDPECQKSTAGDRRQILNQLKHLLGQLPDLSQDDVLTPYPLLAELGSTLQLSRTEQIVLLLMLWVQEDDDWQEISALTRFMRKRERFRLLATICNSNEREISATLSSSGKLARTGLITRTAGSRELDDLCQVLEGLDEHTLQTRTGWNCLVKSLFTDSGHKKLNLDDYAYLSGNTLPALKLLQGAIANKAGGVHILLYGPPGTGKTELGWALANRLGARMVAVKTRDADGEETSGMNRFKSYMLGQRLFSGQPSTLFLFDEIEDVFPSHFGAFFRDSSAFYKGYLNEELESTPLPTIWTANDIDNIDNAHLRRFSYILEVPCPPASVRRKLLRDALKGRQITTNWIRRMSESPVLTPAEIDQFGKIAALSGLKGRVAETTLETVYREKMLAIGHKPTHLANRSDQITYDLNNLNLNIPPDSIIEGLRQSQAGTLLLYGPPGTGKSALAKHLSDQLDKPIIMKRASDLLSMWLGDTEQLIAEAFRTADREKAVLFLDEADSFLRNRDMASRSWEVTQVNEMLVQMENFNGIFIAATNLINDFDMAAFRRFDMKIQFDALTAEQRLTVFLSLLQEKPASLDDNARQKLKSRLAQLDDLAMGDFRAALRNLTIRRKPVTAELFLHALVEECQFKNPGKMHRHPLGFVTH